LGLGSLIANSAPSAEAFRLKCPF